MHSQQRSSSTCWRRGRAGFWSPTAGGLSPRGLARPNACGPCPVGVGALLPVVRACGQDRDFLDRFCGWPRGLGEKPAGRLAALFGPRVGAGGNWSRKSQSCPRFASGPPNRSRKSRSCPLWEAVGGWQVLLSVVWSCRDQWLFWAEVAALRFRACYSWLPTSPCTTASSSSREVTPSLR